MAAMTFPNPCPVCGSEDEHAAWAASVGPFSPATFCPHPAQPGHGTGCCCAGRPKPLLAPPPPQEEREWWVRTLAGEKVTAADHLKRALELMAFSEQTKRANPDKGYAIVREDTERATAHAILAVALALQPGESVSRVRGAG